MSFTQGDRVVFIETTLHYQRGTRATVIDVPNPEARLAVCQVDGGLLGMPYTIIAHEEEIRTLDAVDYLSELA